MENNTAYLYLDLGLGIFLEVRLVMFPWCREKEKRESWVEEHIHPLKFHMGFFLTVDDKSGRFVNIVK